MKDYIVFSLKHTNRKDEFFTLWRPDNKGYTYMLSSAGLYPENTLESGYHYNDDGSNIAVPADEIPDKYIEKDDQGRDCVIVSKYSIKFVKSYDTTTKTTRS